ncbi:MAG: hypothetical protein JXR23_04375 [Pontiellaceae bacterium]|nr:hypothetical protein [Pontiellaceae bacterium]
MNAQAKNWIWFLAIMAMVLGFGIYLGKSRKREPGDSLGYSLDEYRNVDVALIHYREAAPVVPELESLSAVAVGPDGKTYVAGLNTILVYPDERRIETKGTPLCLAIDSSGTVYAGLTNRIELIAPDGTRSEIVIPSDKACLTSLAVDGTFIFAADAGSRKIWRFSHEGGEAFEIGREDGGGQRGFNIPSAHFDIALAGDGSLWAVNPGYHALENHSADGAFLSTWGTSSVAIEGFGGCCNPVAIALLPDGGIVTAEKGLPRVKIHNPDGSLRCVVAAPTEFSGKGSGLDLAVDAAGRILVLDPEKKQIRIFEEKP